MRKNDLITETLKNTRLRTLLAFSLFAVKIDFVLSLPDMWHT